MAKKDNLQLVKGWVLGQKYSISEFQDDMMLQLLWNCVLDSVEPEVIKYAFCNTGAGSKLRKLMAEEMIYAFKDQQIEAPDDDRLKRWNGIPVHFTEIANAQLRYEQDHYFTTRRLDEVEEDEEPKWKEFLIGDGNRLFRRPEDMNED